MRYLFICLALLFSCGSAKAQLTVPQPWYTSLKAPVSYVGPGDLVSGATAWYGLRAYSAAVAATGTQSAVDLRRASDNATCTAKIATNGSVDLTVGTPCSGATVTAFCNATTCLVSKWYDHSGNLRDLSQGTAANQSQLAFNATGSLPSVFFTRASATNFNAVTIPSLSQPLSISAVSKRTSGFGNEDDIIVFGGSSAFSFFQAAKVWILFGVVGSGVAQTDNVFHAFQAIPNGTSSIITVDGSDSTVSGGTNSTGTSLSVPSALNILDGYISEVGVWPGGFTSGQRTSMNANQHSYYGF